jgi:hypothetical protein
MTTRAARAYRVRTPPEAVVAERPPEAVFRAAEALARIIVARELRQESPPAGAAHD